MSSGEDKQDEKGYSVDHKCPPKTHVPDLAYSLPHSCKVVEPSGCRAERTGVASLQVALEGGDWDPGPLLSLCISATLR